MKTILLLCLISCELWAQNINVAHHSYVDEVSNLLSIGTKHFYTERIFSSTILSFSDSSNLIGMNSAGQRIFKVNFNYNEANVVRKTLKTLDNHILVMGFANGCDYDNDPKNFIIKIDTIGNIKFQTVIPLIVSYQEFFRDVVQHSDSSYYLIADSALIHYSKVGQFISRIPTEIAYPTSMLLLNNGNFLINGSIASVSVKNTVITNSAVVVTQVPSNNYTNILNHTSTGNVFGLTYSGTIEKMNGTSFLATNTTSNTLSPDIEIKSFIFKNDSILFTGRRVSTSAPVYGILDNNLNLLYQTLSTYRNVSACGITVSQNKVNIISNATSIIQTNQMNSRIAYIAFDRFPLNGTFLTTPDVGVQSFSVISAEYNPGLFQTFVNLNVTVKNYSNDTIKNFYLNSPSQQMICGFFQFHKFFNEVIPPQGSVVVQTGDFVPNRYLSSNGQAGTKFLANICLFTTVPNQQSDAEITNDKACGDIEITVVGLKENKLVAKNQFEIYPNPFKGELNVKGYTEMNKMSLFNATGKLVKELTVNTKTFSFDNSDLANGMYLLKIETEKGIQIKKIIKE